MFLFSKWRQIDFELLCILISFISHHMILHTWVMVLEVSLCADVLHVMTGVFGCGCTISSKIFVGVWLLCSCRTTMQFLFLNLNSLHALLFLKVSLLLHCWIFHCWVWKSRSDRLLCFLIMVLKVMNHLNALPVSCQLHETSLLYLGELYNSPKMFQLFSQVFCGLLLMLCNWAECCCHFWVYYSSLSLKCTYHVLNVLDSWLGYPRWRVLLFYLDFCSVLDRHCFCGWMLWFGRLWMLVFVEGFGDKGGDVWVQCALLIVPF